MGSSTRAQGRTGTMGAAMPARASTRTEKLVRVSWRTVTERTVYVPVSAWEQMDGAEGDTDGPLDDYLGDVEDVESGDTIERTVTVVEHGFEP